MGYSKDPVEIADRQSRKRAILLGLCGIAFLAVQAMATGSHHESGLWTFTAVLYLLLLATGGGLLTRTKIRALMNDDVTRENNRTAVAAGFWTAMLAALGLYWIPGVDQYSARDAIRVVVTLGIVVSLLVFSYLELRAHRNA
jgi:MFS family permease